MGEILQIHLPIDIGMCSTPRPLIFRRRTNRFSGSLGISGVWQCHVLFCAVWEDSWMRYSWRSYQAFPPRLGDGCAMGELVFAHHDSSTGPAAFVRGSTADFSSFCVRYYYKIYRQHYSLASPGWQARHFWNLVMYLAMLRPRCCMLISALSAARTPRLKCMS